MTDAARVKAGTAPPARVEDDVDSAEDASESDNDELPPTDSEGSDSEVDVV